MVTKLGCQLPDVDGFGRKGRFSFDPECVQDLGWTPDDWKFGFNPDHVKEKHHPSPHPMQLRSASVNEVQMEEYTIRLFNAAEYIRYYDTLSWNKS